MARPRKEAAGADARQRIQSSFWQLLEDNQLHEITIGTITAQACCNRGTFYYHYHDMDDLILHVIEEEILGENALAENIFRLITGASLEAYLKSYTQSVHRISLLLNRGGMDMVLAKMCPAVKLMWKAVLCPDGEELTPEAQSVIEFNVGGILTILAMNGEFSGNLADSSHPPVEFLVSNSRLTIERLADAQGLPVEDVTARLAIANRFINRRSPRRSTVATW